ncbi:MAG: hypothetical protein KF716_33085 [Anaerolineae bacterium]|nr:hypothetical protein [Anaerolineae bacterium]
MANYFICEWKIRKLFFEQVSRLIDTAISCECLLFAGSLKQTENGNFLIFELETLSEIHLKDFVTNIGEEYGFLEWIPEAEWIPETEEDTKDFLNISRSRGKLALTEVCQEFGIPY